LGERRPVRQPNGVEIAANDDRPEGEPSAGMVRFGHLELTATEAADLSDAEITDRLVETGFSRLSAARIVEIGRGAEVARARPHKARR
jgi:hypothetical protein